MRERTLGSGARLGEGQGSKRRPVSRVCIPKSPPLRQEICILFRPLKLEILSQAPFKITDCPTENRTSYVEGFSIRQWTKN